MLFVLACNAESSTCKVTFNCLNSHVHVSWKIGVDLYNPQPKLFCQRHGDGLASELESSNQAVEGIH